jgi:hypothetical protein
MKKELTTEEYRQLKKASEEYPNQVNLGDELKKYVTQKDFEAGAYWMFNYLNNQQNTKPTPVQMIKEGVNPNI